jgi:hypothetical protein
VVTAGPVREDKYAVPASMVRGRNLRNRCATLQAEPELVILFGDSVKGDAVRKLVAFGESLGIPVKYVPGGLFEFARRHRYGPGARAAAGLSAFRRSPG